MGTTFQRGATATIRFTVSDPAALATLGEPSIIIVQEETTLSFDTDRITVDANAGTVSVTLTEAESLRLVDGLPTKCQQAWYDETTGNTFKFPVHDLTVTSTIIDALIPDEEIEPEVEPEVEPYDGPLEDPIGGIIYDDPVEYWTDESPYEPFDEPEPVENLTLESMESVEPSTNVERTAEDDAVFINTDSNGG